MTDDHDAIMAHASAQSAVIASAWSHLPALTEDVTLTGEQIAAFCDIVAQYPQRFDLARLRTASRIVRRPSLGESEWRVTFPDKRQVVVPIAGLDGAR